MIDIIYLQKPESQRYFIISQRRGLLRPVRICIYIQFLLIFFMFPLTGGEK